MLKPGNSAIQLWHVRLGHYNYNTVKTVLQNSDIQFNGCKQFCDACVFGKATQLPFKDSTTAYNSPLQLIYIDIWGPAPILSSTGARYYISFLDAFSKYTWLYILHSKSQALSTFKQFKSLVENQIGKRLQAIQTDNAKEFLCFKTFLHEHGIHHRLTCAYTHEQNGAIERKHRHVIDIGLTILVVASLPLKFSVEAFHAVVHIIHILSTSVFYNNNSYETLFGIKPDYAHLKHFGCACYPLLHPYNKNKFNFRSTCCVFLGYSLQNKRYICLSNTGKLYVSRHVVFKEKYFLTLFLSITSMSLLILWIFFLILLLFLCSYLLPLITLYLF